MQEKKPEIIQSPSVIPFDGSLNKTLNPQQPLPATRQRKTVIQVFDEQTSGALNLACYVKGTFDQPLTVMHLWHQVPADIKAHIIQCLGKSLNSLNDQVINASCQALFTLEMLYPTGIEVSIGLPRHLTDDMDHSMTISNLMKKIRQADGLERLIQWVLARPIDQRDEIDRLTTLYKATRNPVTVKTLNGMSLALAVTFLLMKIRSWGADLSDAAEQVLSNSGQILVTYCSTIRQTPPRASATTTAHLSNTIMNLTFVLSSEEESKRPEQSTLLSASSATSATPAMSASLALSAAPATSLSSVTLPAMSASTTTSAPPGWAWPDRDMRAWGILSLSEDVLQYFTQWYCSLHCLFLTQLVPQH